MVVAVGAGLVASAGAAPYDAAVLSDNPLVYWRMNEAVGSTTAVDSAAAGGAQGGAENGAYRQGTPSSNIPGGVTLGAAGAPLAGDPSNTAASFDGTRTNGSAVATTDHLYANFGSSLGDNYTAEFWFNNGRADANSDLINGYVFNRGLTGAELVGINGTYTGAPFGATASDGTTSSQHKLLAFPGGSSAAISTFNPAEGTWYHVALVRSGTNLKLYLNGSILVEANIAKNYPANDGNIFLGFRSDGAWAYQGMLDEVAIYNAALDASRISAHYQAAIVPDPSTLGVLSVVGLSLLTRRRAAR